MGYFGFVSYGDFAGIIKRSFATVTPWCGGGGIPAFSYRLPRRRGEQNRSSGAAGNVDIGREGREVYPGTHEKKQQQQKQNTGTGTGKE